MTKQVWVVRVVNPVTSHDPKRKFWGPSIPGVWVESLRRMGYLHVVREYDGKTPYEVFEIRAPHGVDSKLWANGNADRMKTMGIDAAAAPEWKPGDRETLGFGFKLGREE